MATSILTNATSNMITTDYSLVVGTTAVTLFQNLQLFGKLLSFMRIWNVSAAATIWCSRAGVAVVNGAGSFPLPPGQYEMFTNPQLIPLNQLSLIATALATPVTIEVG